MDSEDGLEVEIKCNDIQRAIVQEKLEKNCLLNIVSGPGTGKTKTLCDRIAYLMSQGVKPNEILVFSLTNQAVNDFRKTLAGVIGDTLALAVQISTIHSFANTILLSNSSYWQIVMDKSAHHSTINAIMRSNSLRNKPHYWKYFQSGEHATLPKLKNDELLKLRRSDPELYKKYLGFEYVGEISELKTDNLIYDKIVYEATQTLFLYNRIPDDLNLKLNVPFSVLEAKEVMVDEFQDISYILLDFILELIRDKQLTIAGDIDQSLYEFNGATPDYNINKIIPYYQQEGYKLKEFALDETFRFTKDIHKMSINLLGQPKTLIKKAVDEPSLKVVREEFYSIVDESEFIHNEILNLVEKSKGEISPKNIAVLSNTNQSLIDLQTYFTNKKSKYKVKRLTNIFPWMDTKLSTIVSFLKLLENPANDACLIATIGMLNKIGPVTVLNIKQKAEAKGVSVKELLKAQGFPKASKIPNDFIAKMDEIVARVDKSDPSSIMYELIQLCKLFNFSENLEKSNVSLDLFKKVLYDLMEHLKILQQIQNGKANLIQEILSAYQSDFLKRVEQSNPEFDYPEESITFSTIHSAKGLQWDIVFVMSNLAVTGGSTYSIDSRTKYVAATRAKHLLYYNKSVHDNEAYIDTLDTRITDQNILKTRYEKTVLDYIPELNKLAVKNDLNELPKFSKPLSKNNMTNQLAILVNNIKNRNLHSWSNKDIGLSRHIIKMCKKL